MIVLAGLAAAPLAGQAPDRPAPAAETYKLRCAVCHGPDGNAQVPEMNFADGQWKHGSSVKEIAKVISEGVPGTAMVAFKAQLSEKEILELARYVRAFDKTKGNAKPKPRKPGR
ncbi:MAG TPA: c-type cytochrome [Vicinamibacterales bacterium]|nr:c-type cytochrome [Vicinamibacterales bacterium]